MTGGTTIGGRSPGSALVLSFRSCRNLRSGVLPPRNRCHRPAPGYTQEEKRELSRWELPRISWSYQHRNCGSLGLQGRSQFPHLVPYVIGNRFET